MDIHLDLSSAALMLLPEEWVGIIIRCGFSQFLSQPGCNQKYASGPQQGLNDEATTVVAQAKALVLQQPTERALDWEVVPENWFSRNLRAAGTASCCPRVSYLRA